MLNVLLNVSVMVVLGCFLYTEEKFKKLFAKSS